MSNSTLTELKKENAALKAENKKLSRTLADSGIAQAVTKNRWRSLAVIILVVISAVLIFLGNIFFWAGNTVTKTDRYVKTVAPLVEDPAIQTAVATYATQQIYDNVDVEPYIAEVLPPRAQFLAPTLTTQLEGQTKNALNKIVASPKFKQVWVDTQTNAHQRFVKVATNYTGDGTIRLNNLYQYLSGELKNTPLSFLAGKQLPKNVGNIQIAEVKWLPKVHTLVTQIDTWRIIAICMLVLTTAAAVLVSQRRRRTTITLGLTYAGIMFLTLISIRVGREVSANSVNTEYQEAVRHAYQIIVHQLGLQTIAVMLGGLLVAAVAWISGPSRSARAITSRVNTLLAGHAHKALFSKENTATLWLGANKRVIQWGYVGILAAIMLFSRLTPLSLVLFAVIMLVGVLIVELLAAPQKPHQKRVRKA